MTISQAPAGARETFGQRHLHTAPTMAMRGRDSNSGPSPISNTKMQIRDNRKTFAFDLLRFYRRNGPNRRREIRAHARGNGALR